MTHSPTVPRGLTLPELALVLSLVGLVSAIAAPRFHHLRHRLAVEGAASVVMRALIDARHVAARRGERAAVHVDVASGTVTVAAGADTLDVHHLHAVFGVTLAATRDSIAWAPSGLGYGAANASFVLSRGSAAETISVSRAGRVRR